MLQSESSDGQMQIVICFEYGFENVCDLVWSADDLPGDHLSGKPANVREFDSCQRNVRDFTESRGKILLGKSCLKLFIVSCIFASIQVFSSSTVMIWVTLNMPSAAEKCREPSWKCLGIVMEFHIVWRVVIVDLVMIPRSLVILFVPERCAYRIAAGCSYWLLCSRVK